jgi:hypothetical protein
LILRVRVIKEMVTRNTQIGNKGKYMVLSITTLGFLVRTISTEEHKELAQGLMQEA